MLAVSLPSRRTAGSIFAVILWLTGFARPAAAHPLGNFTVNHFARLTVGDSQIRLRYVVDMAEIPTFQEMQTMGGNGPARLPTWAAQAAGKYARGLRLTADGRAVALQPLSARAQTKAGAGGLPTLRLECDLTGDVADSSGQTHRLTFDDDNNRERIGWREIVVGAAPGASVFDSSAFGSAMTDELKAYPTDMLTAPLDERAATLSWTTGARPAGAAVLRMRDGRAVSAPQTDRLAALIAVRKLTPGIMLLGLLLAFVWGAGHALSPGHGKTVVGAYLVGSRGTWRHAVFLGMTVTITHTAGVFALGLVTMLAARAVSPERIFPVLTFISGALVVAVGVGLFAQRLRAILGVSEADHSHGGRAHSHLPPGAGGEPVTWRSLLTLGVSGGLLPCPSALLVLLSAVALHRVAYGLILVVAFSLGLAATLTSIGLAFVYAGKTFQRTRPLMATHPLVRLLPAASAFVIACVGVLICWPTLGAVFGPAVAAAQMGRANADGGPALASLSALAILGLGFVFGLKHATEVDHVVAVSTIVSEHRNLWRSALVGGLWGIGHTISLVAVGAIVLALRVAIPERVAGWLEFGVALMIIGLGAAALLRVRRSQQAVPTAVGPTAARRVGLKPLLVGAMHGLAGSGALTLLVLTQIPSPLVGFLYLAVFGIGSILGMLLMSGLVGLPFAVSARKFTGLSAGLQTAAGVLSLAFGFWYAYETGIASGLWKTLL